MTSVANGTHVPDRFTDAVALHVVKNLLFPRTSLILGLQGPAGEGKTFQCCEVLRRLNVTPVSLSADEFGSEHEGGPARTLVRRYIYASRLVLTGQARAAALVINDIDACLGNFGELVQYTVNTQQLNATIMGLCDSPTRVGEEQTARVPLIVTGNDLRKLYGPLTRPGRMTVFTWRPTLEEKRAIVVEMYGDVPVSMDDVQQLVRRYRRQSVAFFESVKGTLMDRCTLATIREVGLENVVEAASARDGRVRVTMPSIDLRELLSVAQTTANSQRPQSFVRGVRR